MPGIASTDIWEVSKRLRFDEPLEAGDPRFVDTAKARGNPAYNRLLKSLGVDPATNALRSSGPQYCALFCGHRGSGKSTELRQLAARIQGPQAFEVVLLDVVQELDTNNLHYADVYFALAEALLSKLLNMGIELEQVHLSKLQTWFDERVYKHDDTRAFATEAKAGAQVESGVPFLGKLFASVTTAFRTSSTYKEELRRVLKNSFSDFAAAFQGLVAAAESALSVSGGPKKLLFIIDGTDRLSSEDSHNFFVRDVRQLQLVQAHFIYCAPIQLIFEGNINQSFDHVFKLPMIKLREKDSLEILAEGYRAMRELVHHRADRSLFDDESTLDYLIEYSGGHPRDLIRLLAYSFENADGDIFDRPAAEAAVKQLATDYRRLLRSEDYVLLREIDAADKYQDKCSPRILKLLFNLVLLEYNDYWWMSHPAVRTLDLYSHAEGIEGSE